MWLMAGALTRHVDRNYQHFKGLSSEWYGLYPEALRARYFCASAHSLLLFGFSEIFGSAHSRFVQPNNFESR